MATDTEGLITSLYNGVLLRDPTTAETSYWKDQIDGGVVTPVGLVLLGVELPEYTDVALKIASMYEAAFGRYASTTQLMAWQVAYDTGLSLTNIGQSFISSKEFRTNNSEPTSTAQYLQAMATRGLGRDATQAELDAYVSLVDTGVLGYGEILQLIAEANGRGTKVGLAMLAAGLNDAAPEAATIDALGSTISAAVNSLIVSSPFYTTQTTDLDLVEDGGELVISGPLTAEMALNLTAVTVTVGGVDQALRSGKLSDVTSVDATGLTGTGAVSFVGASAVDTYVASPAGDTIRGSGGNDQLTGGSGVDSFVFESTATANGVDTIVDYRIDQLDTLDFSAFVKLTDSNYIGLIDAESTTATSWSDGDVLVVVGNGLTTPAAVAGLFGDDSAFAAPSGRGKAVVIAADVVGDATVWYLVNQVSTATVSADEVSQVAALTGIDNLSFNNISQDSPFYFASTATGQFSLVESSGTLTLSGPLAGDMVLDLDALTVTVDDSAVELSGGMLSYVNIANATGLSGTSTVSFSGTSGAETYKASSAGDTIRGKGGDDQLFGGAGSDSFVFESTATANGMDTITDFKIGSPDVLDFSAFLTVTGTSHIALVDAESTAATAWSNGDVLVADGYNLTTAADVAGLFGAGKAFAAPTNRAKAVVITADIVGDASIWYLVNQVTTTSIEAGELTAVGLLGGVNNLGLLSFTADNFA